jgi:hypothetical protein
MSAQIIDFWTYKQKRKIFHWPEQSGWVDWPAHSGSTPPWAETPQEREALLDAVRGGEFTALRDWWNLRQATDRG